MKTKKIQAIMHFIFPNGDILTEVGNITKEEKSNILEAFNKATKYDSYWR